MRSWLMFGFVILAGCGAKARPQDEIDRAKAAVVASLDSWKANEPVAKLKSLTPPIDFPEELRATHSLTEYMVVKTDGTDPAVIRVTVTLKLKDKKGKASDREVTYAVALKTPIAVARDPYF
jgi:hypothetical protein